MCRPAQRLEMEVHFPAYTGLEPQKIEDGGDIAVIAGAESAACGTDDEVAWRTRRAE